MKIRAFSIVTNMRGDSICPGNANNKIDSEHQVYAVGQECIAYALYIVQNIRLHWQSLKSQERSLDLTMTVFK